MAEYGVRPRPSSLSDQGVWSLGLCSLLVSVRDGNGYIPVGYWPPIHVPARTKFYPSGYPYPYTGRKMLPYPYPAGNLYPTGNPYPKSIPENYI